MICPPEGDEMIVPLDNDGEYALSFPKIKGPLDSVHVVSWALSWASRYQDLRQFREGVDRCIASRTSSGEFSEDD